MEKKIKMTVPVRSPVKFSSILIIKFDLNSLLMSFCTFVLL